MYSCDTFGNLMLPLKVAIISNIHIYIYIHLLTKLQQALAAGRHVFSQVCSHDFDVEGLARI